MVNKGADTVCVVNTKTRSIVKSVDVGSEPRGAVVTPDGAYVYVSCVDNNTVSKIRTSDNTVVNTLSGGFDYPRGMDITPSGDKIYVGHCYNANDKLISVINTSNDAVSQIPLGSYISYCDVALVPELNRLYIANQWEYAVQVLNTNNDTEITGAQGIQFV
ncbi:MAG: hypothetical protein JRK53_11620 [Deltaproteobacteria bacterium]|nr:hypothetical protein [Deltaproteobacteria bacterium]